MILRTLSAMWSGAARPMGDHLWQSTLFAVVAAMLALALRKNQARVRYWVWLSASVKFLIPFSLLIAFGSHLARPRVSTPAQVVVYSAVEDFSQPFVGQVIPAISQAPAADRVSLVSMLPAMAVGVWLVGVGFVLFRWIAGWVQISLMVRKAVPVGEGPEIEALRRLELRVGVGRAIRLVRSADWMEPGIFGILRPVLIWPEGISEHLDGRHVEAIFAHEVCHARRRDNLTAAVHMLVEAVFWFHPLVWWMGARLEEERERACDEEVSLLCDEPQVYAESILKVCKFCSESPLACVSGITGADLKQRIMQIMTERVARKLDLGRKLLLVTVGLGVVAVPIVLAQAKAAQRMMLAAVAAAPKPFRVAAHAIMPLEQTPATGEIAEVQAPSGLEATMAQTQAEARPFAFDVVSIRPAAPPPVNNGKPRMIGYRFTDDGFIATNQSLVMTLLFQYQPEFQWDSSRIVGGGDWARTLRWDIHAKVADSDIAEWSKLSQDPSAPAKERLRATVGAMLAERFKLKTHIETKEGTVYALVVAKGGPKLTPSTTDEPPRMTIGKGGPGHLSFERTEIRAIVPLFAQELGHPVIDKTGITGKYDLSLAWTPTQGGAGAAGREAQAGDSAAASLFTAVQEQLGLKLEAQKGPIETLVIDSAEKPSVDGAEVPTGASLVPVALAQQKTAGPTPAAQVNARWVFDVVSVRAQDPKERVIMAPHGTAEDFEAKGVTAETLIAYGYDLPWTQGMTVSRDPRYLYQAHSPTLLGDPAWASAVQFDLIAKADPATFEAWKRLPPREQATRLKEMVLAMLADRFKLKVHTEKRDMQAYALVVANGGPKISPITGPPPTFNDGSDPTKPYQSPWDGGDLGQIKGHGVTIDGLAEQLWIKRELGSKKVVDQTGLTGRYDFTLKWTPEGDPDDASGVSLFTAIQEQLGLKLEPVKVPMDVVVIDHIERPSEN